MIESFSRTLDLLKFTRRAGFFTTLWVTVYATLWSLSFPSDAIALGYSATEVAMIIGAVMAPITMLQGFVINAYYSKGTHNVIHHAQHKVSSPVTDIGNNSYRNIQSRSTIDRGEVREGSSEGKRDTRQSSYKIRQSNPED